MRRLTIRFDEYPSRGIIWSCHPLPDRVGVVESFDSRHKDEDVIGGGGFHQFKFYTDSPETQTITMIKSRPWLNRLDEFVEIEL